MHSRQIGYRQSYKEQNISEESPNITYDIGQSNQEGQNNGYFENQVLQESYNSKYSNQQLYCDRQRSKKVFDSLHMEAQRQPIQELDLQSKTVESYPAQICKQSDKRKSQISNPIFNSSMEESKVQTVYKNNNFLGKIDQQTLNQGHNSINRQSNGSNFRNYSNKNYKNEQKGMKSSEHSVQKYEIKSGWMKEQNQQKYQQMDNGKQSNGNVYSQYSQQKQVRNKSEEIRHFPVYSYKIKGDLNDMAQHKKETNNYRIEQMQNNNANQLQDEQLQEYDNVDQYPTIIQYGNSEIRQHSILLYKYESNRRLIIRQIKQLLKLNQANQIKLDYSSMKSKVSELAIICRRMRVSMRSRSLRNIKSQQGKSTRKFYGDNSPTKRLPYSQISQHTKDEARLLMLIKQEKDKINRCNIRIVQLDNYVKARKHQISQIQQTQFYDQHDPYHLQSSFSTLNNQNQKDNNFGEHRHKLILFQKRQLIKQSLNSMMDYRSRKVEQVNQEINVLKQELQIVSIKIQRSKAQNKTVLQLINQHRKPKLYSGNGYSQLKGKVPHYRQSSQQISNYKYAQLHVDYNDSKHTNKQKSIKNKQTSKNSMYIQSKANSSRNSSAKSKYTQKIGMHSKSSKDSQQSTPNIKMQTSKHKKSYSNFYRLDKGKKQKFNQNAYNEYFEYGHRSQVAQKKVNHRRKHSQQYR